MQKKTGVTPEKLRQHLKKENIESRPLWKPMHLQPLFKSSPFVGANIAEKLFKCGLVSTLGK